MKLKELEAVLQSLDTFENPRVELEQYATSAHIAARMLNLITLDRGIEGKFIGDLGCGCGTLSIAAALMDAGFCVGFDIDENALNKCKANKEKAECENIDFIQCNVLDLQGTRWHKKFDTVIMNPPFGTRGNEGIDINFLKTAFSLAKRSVYSLHKSSTVRYIDKVAKSSNVKMESLFQLKFDLPQTYRWHKKDSKNIDVHFLKFTFLKAHKLNPNHTQKSH
ncbi:Methyltransferase-like protein 5, partial [Stegodyphus mimosarum]